MKIRPDIESPRFRLKLIKCFTIDGRPAAVIERWWGQKRTYIQTEKRANFWVNVDSLHCEFIPHLFWVWRARTQDGQYPWERGQIDQYPSLEFNDPEWKGKD